MQRRNFISIIKKLGIEYAVAIRSNHIAGFFSAVTSEKNPAGVWLPKEAKVRANRWRKFEHIRWDGKREARYIREIIYGKRNKVQYWEITRDKENLTEENTWFVMTRIPDVKYQEVGEIYGIRNWVEYGFKQCKSELGWADLCPTDTLRERVTHYE